MSLLVVGMSHRTAPVSVLESVTVAGAELPKLLDELAAAESISEVLLLSTCNRVEVYADVPRFHPALADVSAVLSRHSGLAIADLGDYLYVHFAEAAAEHIMSVASGLDSMVIGESQILGQVRSAYQLSVDTGTVGPVLHELAQTALRVGKRVHSDTGIDRVGASVVSVALDHAATALGSLAGQSALVVGAGSMAALAGATLRRAGVGPIVVMNRSRANGTRLADSLDGRFAPLDRLADEIAVADIVVAATGATQIIIGAEHVEADRRARPLALVDLGLPRDVDSALASIAGVHIVDLETLRADGSGATSASAADVVAAQAIIADELIAYMAEQQRLAVAPTVTALRARANQVIDAELARLDTRLPDIDSALRAEVASAVRRAVEKLLHAPTVRVKELASTPEGDSYAKALRELFDLDPAAVESVARPSGPVGGSGAPTATAFGVSSS